MYRKNERVFANPPGYSTKNELEGEVMTTTRGNLNPLTYTRKPKQPCRCHSFLAIKPYIECNLQEQTDLKTIFYYMTCKISNKCF